jgi:HIRAN domain
VKALFVAWQDPDSRKWLPVGRLTRDNGGYRFVYTQGARESKRFRPFGSMGDLDATYVSDELFPLFANRILPKSRPEYQDFLRWLGLSKEQHDALELLARSGGLRGTDTLEIFPCPEPTADNEYQVFFFVHGLRYLTSENQAHVRSLQSGEELFLMRDIQNPSDPMALLLRTGDPMSLVGYCPRYYSAELSGLVEVVGQSEVKAAVEQVNQDAPNDLRLLCKLRAPWPSSFTPCSREQFVPIAQTND